MAFAIDCPFSVIVFLIYHSFLLLLILGGIGADIDEGVRIQSPEIDPYINVQMMFEKVQK